ncbi:hypothetical protein JAAARDRAFT_653611 [Jaapia argillacea MUCL 33604]|uniref:Uncharacterized protein n=1 Tax=Jaapia argillacea MUCL 33604 TaxID=933084 RepID=A0A067PYZ6_9AGAM|nr:hypothetical protein JAAARDRAFT_653611 [Jaapia argillacea MUCL 33604]
MARCVVRSPDSVTPTTPVDKDIREPRRTTPKARGFSIVISRTRRSTSGASVGLSAFLIVLLLVCQSLTTHPCRR